MAQTSKSSSTGWQGDIHPSWAYFIRVYSNRVVLQGEEFHTHDQESNVVPQGDMIRSHELHVNDESEAECMRNVSLPDAENTRSADNSNEVDAQNVIVSENHENQRSTANDLWKNVKINVKIKFRSEINDPWTTGIVISRAGKATRNNASWYNVETFDNRFSVNLEKVEFIKLSPDEVEDSTCSNNASVNDAPVINGESVNVLMTEKDNIMSHEKDKTVYKVKMCEIEEQAKLDEIRKLQEFKTYEIVGDIGQDRITTRWVLTENGDRKKKARLVARG